MNALGLIHASWAVLIRPLIWFVCWCIIVDAVAALASEGDDNNDNAA